MPRRFMPWPLARAAVLPSLALFVFFARAAAAQPPPVSRTPIQDNTIYSESDSSFGAGPCLQVGSSGHFQFVPPNVRRALVLFDLSGLPQGFKVANARLTFRVNNSQASPLPYIRVHRVLEAWGEGGSGSTVVACFAFGPQRGGQPPTQSSSTWNYAYYKTAKWTLPGGSFAGQPSDSALGASSGQTVTFEGDSLLRDVVDWIAHPEKNHGWILTRGESQVGTGIQFASREDPDLSDRPTLTISFAPPTGACCDGNGRCEVITEAVCAARGGQFGGQDSKCEPPFCLEPYVDALPIPSVALPIRGNPGGAATYEIAMKQFRQKLHRDLDSTTVWGYDGRYPGPTIEATRDQPVEVRWINDLRDRYGLPRTDHYFEVDTRIHGPDAEGHACLRMVRIQIQRTPATGDGLFTAAQIFQGQAEIEMGVRETGIDS